MNKSEILKDFDSLGKAKKANVTFVKLAFGFALIAIICTLIWGYMVTQSAFQKILVVERDGRYLEISAENWDKLHETLIKNTCAYVSHYANSFDRLTINENQAKAKFYCNTEDLNRIFNLYNAEKLYHDAIEQGAINKCEIQNFQVIGSEEPYQVKFTSLMTIINGEYTTKFLIESVGTLITTTAQFPENQTGLFFTSYQQTIKRLDHGQTEEN